MNNPIVKTPLRNKIFLRFTLLVGIALIATGSFSVFIAQNTIKQGTITDLLFLSREKSEFIQQIVNEHRNITRLLAVNTQIPETGNEEEIKKMRSNLLSQTEVIKDLKNIWVLDLHGTVWIATDSRREGDDLSSWEIFSRGMNGTYVGPLHASEGEKTHIVSAPIRTGGGELVGVLIAEFDLTRLYNSVKQAPSLGKTGEYLLLEAKVSGDSCFNPRWNVFSSKETIPYLPKEQTKQTQTENNTKNVLSSIMETMGIMNISGSFGERASLTPSAEASSSLCSLAASGQEGLLSEKDENGQSVLAAHHHLSDIGLGLIVKVEEKEIFQPVRLLITALVGTTILMILLITFIALRLSRDVVQPIWKLRKSLEELNTGHFVHRRSIFTGDELEILDAEVKKLAKRLEEAYTFLEQKVRERTQKLAEQHSRDEALIESIGEGFLAVDLTGKVITCNRAAEQMLAWEKSQIINGHFTSVLSIRTRGGELLAPNEHIIQKVIDKKQPVHTLPSDSYECERKTGERFPIAITAVPFMVGTQMRGIVVTFRNVSEERRIDRMKSEFISLASHQLRTPLTAIGWYAELIQNDPDGFTKEQLEYVKQISDSHKRMSDLVNSLLNVSRIELGHLKIEPKKVNINEIIEKTIGELQPMIQEKKIEYKQNMPDAVEATVDPELVQIVIENLASNAIKYTPENGSVSLTLTREGEIFTCDIQDNGMGIPSAQQHKVFEKLFRADNVLKTDTDGTGIGLYITKSIVETWGGKLWFESNEGKGTTFHFTAPLKMRELNTNGGKKLNVGI